MMTINRNSRLAAAFVAGLAMLAPAIAMAEGEGNGPSFPGLNFPDVVIGTSSAASATDAYAGRQPRLLGVTVGVIVGGTLPSNSNGEGEPEPLNSLPVGADNGMPGLQVQQAVEQYWATHQ